MFDWLGRGIAKHPGRFVLAWAVAIAAALVWAMRTPPAPPGEVGSFLPPDSPHNQAVSVIRQAFPNLAANSYIVIIAYRPPPGLTNDDFKWLDELAQKAGAISEGRVLSPGVPFLRHRLVSRDGQAAMALVNLSSNFISARTIDTVDRVTALSKQDRPARLTVEIDGTAGIGRDYFLATKHAADRTTWVTIAAVLIILILVYRSPVGALVPLVSIGASAFMAFVVLTLLTRIGWSFSTMERIFCVVLIFGAGVDFALFWIARYRESLNDTLVPPFRGAACGTEPVARDGAKRLFHNGVVVAADLRVGRGSAGATAGWDAGRYSCETVSKQDPYTVAACIATQRTGPAVLASAATTICGLLTLLTATLVPSRNSGRVLAIALSVALLAALTLTPALARLLGRWLFWPMGPTARAGAGERFIWPRLADVVTRRPAVVLILGVLVMAAPAAMAWGIEPRFDSLSELPPGSSSSRAFNIAREHFSKGQLYSNTLLLVFDKDGWTTESLQRVSAELSSPISRVPGVLDVYSLDAPLGRTQARTAALLGGLLSPLTRALYISQLPGDGPVLRFEILIDHLPFSPEAIAGMERVRATARQTATAVAPPDKQPRVMIAGPTSYIIDVRQIATADQRRVMVLATFVIAVIVLLLVRDLPLTLFMVTATWLTYGVTLTVSELFFVHLKHEGGLDWKVRLILFVIVVAVGQDYNIFLVSRLLDNGTGLDRREATRRAIIRTGSVISSCGIIMAATLGSLWAGRLSLLQQLGFALALGILIDTFFVRPLLIPSFYLVLYRLRGGMDSGAPQAGGFPVD